ncbi:response regulator [Echinicola sediminis]
MKNKVNCILLIDDDEPTHLMNKVIIRKTMSAEKVIVVKSGIEALAYLNQQKESEGPFPNLIFLDINMPAMNGWEFMEEYRRFSEGQKSDIFIVMLSTSDCPDDLERASRYREICEYETKPLTIDKMKRIIDLYFKQEDCMAK